MLVSPATLEPWWKLEISIATVRKFHDKSQICQASFGYLRGHVSCMCLEPTFASPGNTPAMLSFVCYHLCNAGDSL